MSCTQEVLNKYFLVDVSWIFEHLSQILYTLKFILYYLEHCNYQKSTV